MANVPRRIALALALLLLLLLAGGFAYLYLPYDYQARQVQIEIPDGQRLAGIARGLANERVLRCPRVFLVMSRVFGKDRGIRAGAYRLDSSMSPLEILENLSSGRVALHRLTVREGAALNQVAEVLQAEGLSTTVEVLAVGSDPRLARELGIEGASLEGYLFPDTYYFPLGQPAREILTAMVRRFWHVYSPQMRMSQVRMGWRIHEVVTLASIIEKETSRPEEKLLISSTLHNRLAMAMPLQCDPTVIYGLDSFDGRLRREHLLQDSDYNTYVNKGLPPGPICNPGLDSLKAALNPAATPYLFFVSKNDGSHYFSSTIEEHNRAVRAYQKEGKRGDESPATPVSKPIDRRLKRRR